MATLYRPRVVRRGAAAGGAAETEAGAAAAKKKKKRGARIGPTDARGAAGREDHPRHDDLEEGAGKAAEARVDTGVVGGAAGSAFLQINGTRVVCSVRGPRAIKRSSDFGDEGALDCRVRLAPFALYGEVAGNAQGAQSRRIKREQLLAGALTRAIKGSVRLDRFPKSVLEIDALVLSDDGAAQAVIPSCASLAIADSGVEIKDLVACAHVGVVDSAGAAAPSFIVNPSTAQRAACSSAMTMALLPASETVADIIINGSTSYSLAGETSKRCFEACIALHRVMRDHLVAKAQEAFAALEVDDHQESH